MLPPTRLVLFLIFVALPLLEIAILIKVGQLLGFWPTILLVVVTAIVGAQVLHSQGLSTLHRANESVAAGRPPMEPVMEGVLLLLAGTLLVTPGVLTDLAGLVLLVPAVRRPAARAILQRALTAADIEVSVFEHEETFRTSRGGSGREPKGGVVIDGEFERLDERTMRPGPGREPPSAGG